MVFQSGLHYLEKKKWFLHHLAPGVEVGRSEAPLLTQKAFEPELGRQRTEEQLQKKDTIIS